MLNGHTDTSVLSKNAEEPFYVFRLLEALINSTVLQDAVFFSARSSGTINDQINTSKLKYSFNPAIRLYKILNDHYLPDSLMKLIADDESSASDENETESDVGVKSPNGEYLEESILFTGKSVNYNNNNKVWN